MYFTDVDTIYYRLSEKISKIFPHIENIFIIYKNNTELNFINNGKKEEFSTYLNSKTTYLRGVNINYQWLLPSDFIDNERDENLKIHQFDLLDEHENRLLVLNIKSPFDLLNDCVCITFPKEITFLGMYKSIKNITTDDKILIGELLHKLCQVELENELNHIKKQKRIATYFELKSSQNEKLSFNQIELYLKSELNHFLSKRINKTIDFEFDDSLITYIITNKYSIDFTCDLLTEAFEIIQSIEDIGSQFKFELFHFQMILKDKKIEEQRSNNTIIQNSKDKTLELLDKLESAALHAEKDGSIVNGKSVSQYLSPPVSPPAVTDMLKKNINKIEIKLRENPEKWTLIRKFLKPLREIEFKNQLLYSRKSS